MSSCEVFFDRLTWTLRLSWSSHALQSNQSIQNLAVLYHTCQSVFPWRSRRVSKENLLSHCSAVRSLVLEVLGCSAGHSLSGKSTEFVLRIYSSYAGKSTRIYYECTCMEITYITSSGSAPWSPEIGVRATQSNPSSCHSHQICSCTPLKIAIIWCQGKLASKRRAFTLKSIACGHCSWWAISSEDFSQGQFACCKAGH